MGTSRVKAGMGVSVLKLHIETTNLHSHNKLSVYATMHNKNMYPSLHPHRPMKCGWSSGTRPLASGRMAMPADSIWIQVVIKKM